jgi:hypothetical protein
MRLPFLFRLVPVAGLGLIFVGQARAVGQFDIHLDPGPGLSSNPAALAAFRRAADEWQSRISSPVRINIDADLSANSDPRVIGSTDFPAGANLNQDYNTVRNAMAGRAGRAGDAILAFLPTSANVSANVLANATLDRTTLGITPANLKALGLVPGAATSTAADGVIRFNSNFSFAYDRANLNGSNVDFQTVAAHEIGHVLGFLSDVDDFDSIPGLTSDNLTTLDLFRFNDAQKPATAAQFRALARELRPGQPSVTTDTSVTYSMSTGANLGDGNQASHWKADEQTGVTIGIMDPTLNYGTIENVGDADLRAMELIGYDTVPVPEPASLGIIGVAAIGLLSRRRVSVAGSVPASVSS